MPSDLDSATFLNYSDSNVLFKVACLGRHGRLSCATAIGIY